MVNGNDLRVKLGEKAKDIQSPEYLFNWSPVSGEIGTYTIFWHKIQDNMPEVIMTSGRFDTPLISKEDELKVANPYPKSY